MSSLQPINTAPRDGTRILAWNEDAGFRETYMDRYGEGSIGYSKYIAGDGPLNIGWYWGERNACFRWEPTHWMPRPALPGEVERIMVTESDGSVWIEVTDIVNGSQPKP